MLQALPDEQILELRRFGQQAATLFASPQDVEWGWDGQRLYILQSRPITSLFPALEGLPAEPLKVFFSFGAVQGMLDPLTPLGRDALGEFAAMAAQLFGMKLTRMNQPVFYTAGERLWANFTPLLKNSVGRRILPTVLDMVEPTVRQAIEQIWDDPRLQPGKATFSHQARARIVRFAVPMAGNILLNMAAPKRRREFIVRQGEELLELMQKRCAAIQGDPWQKLDQQARLLPDFAAEKLPITFRRFVSGVAAGMASWNLLNLLATKSIKDQPAEIQAEVRDLVLQVTRGMPFNPTTEMDLDLWAMAQAIRKDPASLRICQENEPSELAKRYLDGDLPETLSQAVTPFMNRYGGRGFCEIDLGRSRWSEDPTHVFEMLTSFLQIENGPTLSAGRTWSAGRTMSADSQAPDVVFARGAVSAQQAIEQLAQDRAWLPVGLAQGAPAALPGRARPPVDGCA